jgi:hypothetical protein
MKKNLFIIIVVIFVFNLLFHIYSYRNDYLTPYNPTFWKNSYDHSQWSTNPGCANLNPHVNPYTCVWDDHWYQQHKNDKNAIDLKKRAIGDDAVYTYAGWEYIHGHDPTTLNAELPPVGKYLIGLSEVIFHNQNIFSLLSGLFALGAFYLFNILLFKDKFFAFIPVVLFSFEPLFFTQLNTPLLDTLYLGLLFLVFYFFLKKKYAFSAISLGLMAATKAAISTFPLAIGVIVIYLFLTKQNKEIFSYIYSLPLAGIAFVLTYFQFFFLGHSFMDFLGVQNFIVNFYSSGAKGVWTTPWEMLATGKWHTWWGTYVPVDGWHIGWLLVSLLSLCTIVVLIKKRSQKPFLLIALWIVAYLVFLSLVATWPRYLLLVLPFMYNLSIWLILKKIKIL